MDAVPVIVICAYGSQEAVPRRVRPKFSKAEKFFVGEILTLGN